MGIYELAILGAATEDERARLVNTLGGMVADFGLQIGTDVVIHDATTIGGRDLKAAFSGTYFGGDPTKDLIAVDEILRSSAPIIPTITSTGNFATEIPDGLHYANGLRRRNDDPELNELAAVLLECVGLLRKQRRVFISYRRIESKSAAIQMHDLLTSRGFDVFLDTHDVRPGEPFQEVLWHRLCDSDVLIMLDTQTYFASKWTRYELGRARAKEIHVLRLVWPENAPNRLMEFSESIYLGAADLTGPDGPIVPAVAEDITALVERLRSKSIATRYMSIVGRLRADIQRIGATIAGIGAHRAVAVRLEDARVIWAYPVVGIPTAELLNDVAEKARNAGQSETPALIYDHVGISDAWNNHLRWLDNHIRVVKAVRSCDVSWQFAAWEPPV